MSISTVGRAVGCAMVGLLIFTGVACAPARSVEAYCAVMEKHKERYLDATDAALANENILGGSLQMMSAVGDLSAMFNEAADVAPAEIVTDVEQIAEWWGQQEEVARESVGNPLGGLAAAVTGSIYNGAAMTRVDEYTATNCPSVGRMF